MSLSRIEWCLREERRLKQVSPSKTMARLHLEKSEYNAEVMRELESLRRFDWALNVGFYATYHCFLALLWLHGYRSRNQSCTVAVLLGLIDEKRLDLDKALVLGFDTFDDSADTVRHARESSTYGIKSSIDEGKLDMVRTLMKEVQRQTIRILKRS